MLREEMVLNLIRNGFEREDEIYLSNNKYGYLVKLDQFSDILEIQSVDSMGYMRVPFYKIEFEDGTIKFKLGDTELTIGTSDRVEAFVGKLSPRKIREEFEDKIFKGKEFVNFGDFFLKLEKFYLLITNSNINIHASLKSVEIKEDKIVAVVAGTEIEVPLLEV